MSSTRNEAAVIATAVIAVRAELEKHLGVS